MSAGEIYWATVEPLWDAVSIYDGEKVFLRDFEAAEPIGRTLFVAHWCQTAVRNGGFHQFFSNSTGVLATEAVDSFREIGMPKVSALVNAAVGWFSKPCARARTTRQRALANHRKEHPTDLSPFERLDEEFFRLIDSENGGFVHAADLYALAERS